MARARRNMNIIKNWLSQNIERPSSRSSFLTAIQNLKIFLCLNWKSAICWRQEKLWSVINSFFSWHAYRVVWLLFVREFSRDILQQFFPKLIPQLHFCPRLQICSWFHWPPFGALVFGRFGDSWSWVHLLGNAYFNGRVNIRHWADSKLWKHWHVCTHHWFCDCCAFGFWWRLMAVLPPRCWAFAWYKRGGFYTSLFKPPANALLVRFIAVILVVRETGWHFGIWWLGVGAFLLSVLLLAFPSTFACVWKNRLCLPRSKQKGKISKIHSKKKFYQQRKPDHGCWLHCLVPQLVKVLFGTRGSLRTSFIQKVCSVEFVQSYTIIATAL